MDWLIYLLLFVFGYVTCSVLYFLRSMRTSIRLLKTAQIVYLSILVKALEYYYYARGIALEHMLLSEKNSASISSFEYRFDEDIQMFKRNGVKALQNHVPHLFESTVDFKSWDEAMSFLEKNRNEALEFWSKNDR